MIFKNTSFFPPFTTLQHNNNELHNVVNSLIPMATEIIKISQITNTISATIDEAKEEKRIANPYNKSGLTPTCPIEEVPLLSPCPLTPTTITSQFLIKTH